MLLVEVTAICDRCRRKVTFQAPPHRLHSAADPVAPEGWKWLYHEATQGGLWPLVCPDCCDRDESSGVDPRR